MNLLKMPSEETKERVVEANPPINHLYLFLMLVSYNIRGINKKPKQAYVRQLILDNSISLVGLLETRVRQHNANRISRAICRN